MVVSGGDAKFYIMSIKYLFLIIFCCISCDVSKPFVINGKEAYVSSDQCGSINIKGTTFSTLVIIGFAFDGKYHIIIDSLKIEAMAAEDIVTNIRFRLNNKDLTENELEIESETLSLSFDLISTIPYRSATKTVLLLPSNFISCEGKQVISDTIEIYLKN